MADSIMSPGLVLVDNMDISKLKVPDLKKELKNRGLNTTGNKVDLIERLQNALKSAESTSNNESVDDLDEDLLNEEDDDVHLEETTESMISDIDTSLISDTLTQKAVKRKSDQIDSENSLISSEKAIPTKKVVLNRNNPLITDTRTSIDSKDGSEKSNGSAEDKKIIKLSTVSAKERLEMRAKKFEVSSISNEARKAVRAERFSSSLSANSLKQIKVFPTADVLQKRAERFGTSVKPVDFTDSKERMEKRKARFGIVTAEDKAKQRLDRFKQSVK